MKNLGIKWKIFSYLLCFCAILLSVLWIFQTVLLSSFYRSIKVKETKKTVKEIVSLIENNEDLMPVASELASRNESYIEVMTSEGITLVSVGDMKNRIQMDKKHILLSKLKNGEYVEYYNKKLEPHNMYPQNDFKDRGPIESIMYIKEASNGQIVLINSMISPVNATVNTLRYQLYIITGLMILFSIVFAIIIAHRVSKPIEKLNKSAKYLAKGKYDINFTHEGYREIGELSDTLNVASIELNKVESLRRELLANISHDLRTPLSLIYSYAEVMHDFPEDITSEQTQTIMDEIERLSSLVNDVLDISQLESGNQSLTMNRFNLTKNLEATLERIEELVRSKGYELEFSAEKEVWVEGDEIKLTQVFYNLLINAINYTGEDKKVSVRQLVDSDSVRIEVIDTGDGIANEDIPYIWERYYKVDKNHKRSITGTGLGLSIVKKVMEMHGGNYGVESEQGKGSTFWFTLKKA